MKKIYYLFFFNLFISCFKENANQLIYIEVSDKITFSCEIQEPVKFVTDTIKYSNNDNPTIKTKYSILNEDNDTCELTVRWAPYEINHEGFNTLNKRINSYIYQEEMNLKNSYGAIIDSSYCLVIDGFETVIILYTTPRIKSQCAVIKNNLISIKIENASNIRYVNSFINSMSFNID